VSVREDNSEEIVKHVVREGTTKKTLKWSAPPAGVDYELYNTGPATVNVTWLWSKGRHKMRSTQRIFYPTAGTRIANRFAASKTPSSLACQTVIVAAIAVAGALLTANMAHAKARPCSLFIAERECCSSQDCSGHVLSNRASAKECRRTYGGKSWHPASEGQGEAECTNL
jgi:hypothetical protein